jgi:photosystem II stability/assembly factor-like uncharacterized protein
MSNTGFSVIQNGVQTDLINVFEQLPGTKITYATNYLTANGTDLTDIFQAYVAGDPSANPTNYITLNGGQQKDLNLLFKVAYLAPTFPTSGGTLTTQYNQVASMYNNNAITGLYGGVGIYYSTDYGKTYAKSTGISGIGTTAILGVSIYGLHAITHTATLAFYSSNAGQSWTSVSNLPGVSGSRSYQGCSIYENYAIIADLNGKIYVSADYGVTWATISATTVGSYRTPSISYDPVGAKYIAVCTNITSGNSVWYCTNFTGSASNNFVKCTQTTINSYGVSLVGLKGVAGAISGGFYYTTDGGQTWTKATDASGTITTNVGSYMCSLSTNGVGIAHGTTNVYYVTKNYGITWSQPSSIAYGVNTMHNGNAVMYVGNAPSQSYYGKISL